VDSGEIVVYGVDRNHRRVILNFLTESVRQSRKAPHAHSHAQVVALYIGRAYVLRVWIAADRFHLTADARSWRIPRVGRWIAFSTGISGPNAKLRPGGSAGSTQPSEYRRIQAGETFTAQFDIELSRITKSPVGKFRLAAVNTHIHANDSAPNNYWMFHLRATGHYVYGPLVLGTGPLFAFRE
jgi:hypothetical protein